MWTQWLPSAASSAPQLLPKDATHEFTSCWLVQCQRQKPLSTPNYGKQTLRNTSLASEVRLPKSQRRETAKFSQHSQTSSCMSTVVRCVELQHLKLHSQHASISNPLVASQTHSLVSVRCHRRSLHRSTLPRVRLRLRPEATATTNDEQRNSCDGCH